MRAISVIVMRAISVIVMRAISVIAFVVARHIACSPEYRKNPVCY